MVRSDALCLIMRKRRQVETELSSSKDCSRVALCQDRSFLGIPANEMGRHTRVGKWRLLLKYLTAQLKGISISIRESGGFADICNHVF